MDREVLIVIAAVIGLIAALVGRRKIIEIRGESYYQDKRAEKERVAKIKYENKERLRKKGYLMQAVEGILISAGALLTTFGLFGMFYADNWKLGLPITIAGAWLFLVMLDRANNK